MPLVIPMFISCSDLTDWEDKEILDAYLAHINVGEEEYYSFLKIHHLIPCHNYLDSLFLTISLII